jgi:hypothetical protein
MSPASPTDDELLKELKRVRSDLGFRKWISLRVKIVAALVIFDLVVSVLSVVAIIIVRDVQVSECDHARDNRTVLRTVVDIATTPTGGGTVDLTKIAGFSDLDPPTQTYLRNLSAGISKANPPGEPSLHDRLLAQLPSVDC